MGSKRENLVEATKSLLWEVGYESMSPKIILKKSGAGQGSLYHHFEGKKDLAATALAEIEAEMCDLFDQILNADKSPLTRISEYLKIDRDGLKGCRLGRLSNESLIADETLRKPLATYFNHVEKVLSKTISEAVAKGELIKRTQPKAIAAALVATVQGGYILSRVHQDPKHIHLATNGALTMLEGLKTK